jgi:hypothetical protein
VAAFFTGTQKQEIKMKTKTQSVEILEFQIQQVTIPITGISPLIVHRFSEKAMKMIQDKQAGKAKNKKHDVRDPSKHNNH